MGPMVIYDLMSNTLKFWNEQVGTYDKEKRSLFEQVLEGAETPTLEGEAVFTRLTEILSADVIVSVRFIHVEIV